MSYILPLIAILAALQASPAPGPAPGPVPGRHPLDPLTPDEITLAVQLARADARVAAAAFPRVALLEPAKADVLAGQPGRTLPRQALVQAMTRQNVFDITVDLSARRLVSVIERPGLEPAITYSEVEAAGLVLSHPPFVAALARRGVTDPMQVFCAPFSAGYYGLAAHEGKRLLRVGCFDTRRSTTNVFAWPIERLYALVDLRTREVLGVTDGGVVPIAPGNLNYEEAAVGALRPARKPTIQAQPDGSNVRIDGHSVTWGRWRFHVRLDPRVGTIVSQARWDDGAAAPRSVLYQGYLSEMFVPYMDPDDGWQSRTYFDAGEYGAGVLATALERGVDCSATATFLPAAFATDTGEPFTTPDALCVFERSLGEPIWRHREAVNQTYEGRANVELVVRMASTIAASNHARLLLDPQDWPARRARFLAHDLWVTPYAAAERYAGGESMVGSKGEDGLAVWTAKDRPIRKQDLVVWVNLGMHHFTRAEDVPVMPKVWHSFRLRPHNFFDLNPAIDLRRDPPPATAARP